MFSASPPTTDMRWLHRNDRFVPSATDMAMQLTKGKAARRRHLKLIIVDQAVINADFDFRRYLISR
jgi:hypothetical protein